MRELLRWQMERAINPKMHHYREIYKKSSRIMQGDLYKGKTVIIYCEQGMGDVMQMLRFVPVLRKQVEKLYIHCFPELHNLIKLNWDVETIDRQNPHLPKHDFHILSMDLPYLFPEDVSRKSYIHVRGSTDLGNHKRPYIGIAWEGNPYYPNNKDRSCPLKYFKNLDGTLFRLQKEMHLPYLREDCDDMNVLSVPLYDFVDTAKMINSLDFVVTIDTAVMHLCGSMGKKTYGLLCTNCDPRWGKELDHTPWYRSIKFLRQKEEGNWEGVIDRNLITP